MNIGFLKWNIGSVRFYSGTKDWTLVQRKTIHSPIQQNPGSNPNLKRPKNQEIEQSETKAGPMVRCPRSSKRLT